MEAQNYFIGLLVVFLLFNVFLLFVNPTIAFDMTLGGILGFIILSLAVITVTGWLALNGEIIKIVFGVVTIVNLLFQIDILGYPVGMGLATNIIEQFNLNEGMGLGWILATSLCIVALISGLIVVTSD